MRKSAPIVSPTWRVLARSLGVGTLVLLTAACGPTGGDRIAHDPAAGDPTARYLDDWYSCIECVDGQLDSLVRLSLGSRADSVWHELARGVRIGPLTADLGAFQAAAETDYDSTQASLRRLAQDTISQSRTEYAKDELDTYIRLYRARSAIALMRIDSVRARPIVDSATRRTRDPVLVEAFTRILPDTL